MAVISRRKKKAIAVLAIYLLLKQCQKRKKRSCWKRPWIARRDEQGAYTNLVRELELDGSLHNYLRITKTQFDDIVARVTPLIKRQNTTFQASITPGERIAVTLRFLATGN
jgi:hypothetical protein